jgi:2-hydroxychromene-2-carboxylate isomerase
MKSKIYISLLLVAVALIPGCTSSETVQTEVDPSDQEIAIAEYYYDCLWADQNISEDEVRGEVAAHFGITEDEVSEIYAKVVDYNFKTTGKIGL